MELRMQENQNKSHYPYCLISPRPDIEDRFRNTRRLIAEGREITESENTIDLRTFSLLAQRPRNNVFIQAPSKVKTTGTLKALVILVDFSDNQKSTAKSHYEDLLFSSGTHSTGSMHDYFKESSYGALSIVGEVLGWYRMPQPYAFYVDNQNGFGTYPKNVQKLIEDAVDAANVDVNYANYDSDGDGYVDALFIVHSGVGAETTGRTDQIWSHRWSISDRTLDGVKIRDYTCEAEDGKIGLFCHELTHVFNIPDLYDTDYSSRGIGRWCLMAGGSWNNNGLTPSQPSAWVKKTLGWVSPTNVTSDQSGVSLVDIETNAKMYRLWTGGSTGKEYFLVENRQKKGFDSHLPSSGLAIWHIDENRTTNSDETHYLVALEQADAKLDLEKNVNNGDAGDLYRGTSANSTFDTSSTPNSKSYSGSDTKVSVSNINDSSSTITFDVKVGAAVVGGWRNNCKITQLWATNTTAWVYIASPGAPGWRELTASTKDMFAIAIKAKIYGKLVNIYEDPSSKILIINMV
jgi:immune inhibitor A